MAVLQMNRPTVCVWVNRWQTGSLVDLTNAAKQGRRPVRAN